MDSVKSLDEQFRSALNGIVEATGGKGHDGESTPPTAFSLRVRLEGVGEIETHVGKATNPSERTAPRTLGGDNGPVDNATRVQKAKALLASGDTYGQGCSDFICAVLGIPWEAANDLMGNSPEAAGDNNVYTNLQAGDIAGWKSTSGSGHITLYLGEGQGKNFIDVRTEGDSPRSITGYGMQRPLFKSSRF